MHNQANRKNPPLDQIGKYDSPTKCQSNKRRKYKTSNGTKCRMTKCRMIQNVERTKCRMGQNAEQT
jgi:hypothetical protein